MFFKVRPLCPAQLGKNTVYDKAVVPWKIEKLHVIFDVWSEDDILRESPAYYITQHLYAALSERAFTGFDLGEIVRTEVSDTFINLYDGKELPPYFLIHIVGQAFKDDFGLVKPNRLVVSSRALELLKDYSTSDMEIEGPLEG